MTITPMHALLQHQMSTCVGCALCHQRHHVVHGRGPAPCPVAIYGEAPGEKEDEHGVAFLHHAGQLLDRFLCWIGVDPARVYISNIVHCRPRDNHTPNNGEIEACTDRWLPVELDLVQPRLVLALGNVASRVFCGDSVRDARGTWHQRAGRHTMATFHPAHLLYRAGEPRTPETDTGRSYLDYLLFRQKIDEVIPGFCSSPPPTLPW